MASTVVQEGMCASLWLRCFAWQSYARACKVILVLFLTRSEFSGPHRTYAEADPRSVHIARINNRVRRCLRSFILPGTDVWLGAFTVALGQASEGKWYVSTLELQRASFEICVACRGVRTLRITVGKCMPLSLWGDDESFDNRLRRPKKATAACSTSV